jgi:hypothetical protein
MRIFFLLWLFASLVGAEAGQPVQFQDATKTSGLFDPLRGLMGHAAAWGDYDRDGRPDLFVGGFCDRPNSEYEPAKGPVPSALFHNEGNGRFQWVKNTPVAFCGRTAAAMFVDLNADAFPELYVSNNPKGKVTRPEEPQATAQKMHSKLFENRDGTFHDVSPSSGASPEDLLTARNIGVFDYNNDGLLDLFVVEDRFQKGKKQARSILLKNKGGLKFEIANDEAGLPDDIYGLGMAVADLNNDGRPDLFIAHSNRLFLSQPGNRYREAAQAENIFRWNPLDNEDWPAGAAFGDLNGDGNPDLVIGIHHAPARNKIYLNRGLRNDEPVFEDVTEKSGLGTPVPAKSPHVEIEDFDNDGRPDIYFSAAWKTGDTVLPLIYRNTGANRDGIPQFTSIGEIKSGMIYFPAGPSADVNGDGRLDLFLVSWVPGEPSRLLINNSPTANWLDVKAPTGSKIKLTADGKLIGSQQVYPGFGFASGELPVCHFGLGSHTRADIEVKLPNGGIKSTKGASVNRVMEFK